LDGAAPFYTTYRTADGEHMAVGALEPQFFAELLRVLELDPETIPAQSDREGWSRLRQGIADRFATRTRDEWANAFESTDACVTPVLRMDEAPRHPHNRARSTFVSIDDVTQPAPAPRFSVTRPDLPVAPPYPGEHTEAIVLSLGYSRADLGMLRRSRVVA
jgi:alpha-methylacyl-CoA racemase